MRVDKNRNASLLLLAANKVNRLSPDNSEETFAISKAARAVLNYFLSERYSV